MGSGMSSLLAVTSDFVFKLIFGDQRCADILAKFLSVVLNIPLEEFDQLIIVDPHVKKEHEDDKYGILDVRLATKNGAHIHIEIQVLPIPDIKQRLVYYQAKLITGQIQGGNDWDKITRTISIVITDFNLIDNSPAYHHQFRYRTQDGITLTDLTEINILELPKLPTNPDNTELSQRHCDSLTEALKLAYWWVTNYKVLLLGFFEIVIYLIECAYQNLKAV